MKSETLELTLLFDYYGEMLTEKQRDFFDLHYNQDLSLAEIALDAGVSRQSIHDSILRAEQSLRLMEKKIGAVARDRRCRLAAGQIAAAASQLLTCENGEIRLLAREILTAADTIKE